MATESDKAWMANEICRGRNKYYARQPSHDREARGKAAGRYLGFWSIIVAAGLVVAKYLLPAY